MRVARNRWWLLLTLLGSLVLYDIGLAQVGVRSYVVRRVFTPGSKQRYNVVYSLRGETGVSTITQTLPASVEAQLELRTEVLSVDENGRARIRTTERYVKQEVDFFNEEELPPPSTEIVRVTPSGLPVEDEQLERFRREARQQQKEKQKRSEDAIDEKVEAFPGFDFLLPPSFFLSWIGLAVVPGPFYPLPPGAVREGDQWEVIYPTPFINTQGGRLDINQATIYTYPATVKVVGTTEIKGRPVLHVQQIIDTEIDFPLDDTLIELTRLRDRSVPRGRIKGTLKGTSNFYYTLADGALIQADGEMRQKLRIEYDERTVREWEPEERWAEWDVQIRFRQVLAEETTPQAQQNRPTNQRTQPRQSPQRRR